MGYLNPTAGEAHEDLNDGAQVGGSADLSAIAEDVLPATDDTYDLGSAAKRFAEAHIGTFLAVGDDPASTGEVRLSNGNAIVSDSAPVDLDNSGWLGGDIPLIKLVQNDNTFGGRMSVLQIGERNVLNNTLILDGFYNNALFMQSGSYVARATFDPTSNPNAWLGGTPYGQLGTGNIRADDGFGGFVFSVDVSSGALDIRLVGIPTSDPGVGRKVWSDSGVLKVTAAS